MGPEKEKVQSKQASGLSAKFWLPVVLLIGTIAGILSYLYTQSTFTQLGLGPGGPSGAAAFLEYHAVLSTISIALLIALLVVYGKTYTQTKANFMLGLIVVLLALLLQSLLNYPILHPYIDNTPLESMTISSPVSDAFTILAYTVFLYLSLE
jgi:hypothetical protein